MVDVQDPVPPIPASGTSPPDPLDALRTADLRPLRARVPELIGFARGWERQHILVSAFLVVAVVVLVARWLVPVDPPIEDSLPMASATSVVMAVGSTPLNEAGIEATDPAIVVHVAGAVDRPGLVTGEVGWRVADAVASAGLKGDADLDRMNLAAHLRDGERIWVPAIGEEAAPALLGSSGLGEANGPIDLNTAEVGELDELPGVGPATAAAIVEHRQAHGPFASVDALVAVRGIGTAKLDALREHVTVG